MGTCQPTLLQEVTNAPLLLPCPCNRPSTTNNIFVSADAALNLIVEPVNRKGRSQGNGLYNLVTHIAVMISMQFPCPELILHFASHTCCITSALYSHTVHTHAEAVDQDDHTPSSLVIAKQYAGNAYYL